MSKSNSNELTFSIIGGTISLAVITTVSIYNLVKSKSNSKNNSKEKIESEYYDKFYKILFRESGLDKDPYKRKLSSQTVKTFCSIAKSHGLKLEDDIDSKTFDHLYSKLVEQQISVAKTNNINK
jgi:hypothetical protein